jgi:ribonuclease J
MKVCIHRGSHEIGGSCVEIMSSGETLLIDAGLPLSTDALSHPVVPAVDRRALRCILISHPHMDHYGLLPWMPNVPVAMGAAARRILKAAQPYMGERDLKIEGPDLLDRQPISIGPFRITPYLVDHSAYDAYSLLIEADNKRLFYSGDIRIHGRKSKLVERLLAYPPDDIDALLLEGSTLGRDHGDHSQQTENQIEDAFVEAFKETPGLALVHVSAQNMDRLVSIFRACLKTGRTLLIDLYAAEVLAATGNPKIPQSDWQNIGLCIPQRQRLQIKRNQWFEALARHSANRVFLKKHVARSPEKYVLLFRSLWMRDLVQAECLKGACLIHSQWAGYLREDRFVEVESWREAHGIQFRQIHTSGHASPGDLLRIAAAINPKKLVPIHTDNPSGYDSFGMNVVFHPDGEWWEV